MSDRSLGESGPITEVADQFWAAVGNPIETPRDLQRAVSLALPVTTFVLPALALDRVSSWLSARGVNHRFDVGNRHVRGCLVASAGHGFVFVDGIDSPEERRFTLAHEIAHFLLDYLAPRDRAIRKLGAGITAVLDGVRPPTIEERLDALLAVCHLGVHTHLMERAGDAGARAGAVEDRADRLAWEILAPAREVVRLAPVECEEEMAQVLVTHFALPAGEAQRYARLLKRRVAPPPSFVDWLRR